MYGSASAWGGIPRATRLVILVSRNRDPAEHEKAELTNHLRQSTGLELSEERTRISDLAKCFEFLGHRVRHKWHPKFGFNAEGKESQKVDERTCGMW
jgi:hypothetical protein